MEYQIKAKITVFLNIADLIFQMALNAIYVPLLEKFITSSENTLEQKFYQDRKERRHKLIPNEMGKKVSKKV